MCTRLFDPRNDEVRYVGKSTNVASRVKGHLRDRGQTRKARWIRSLARDGVVPTAVILESGTDDWESAEVWWIAYFRALGFDLTNATIGGEGLRDPSPETRALIGSYRRKDWDDEEKRIRLLAILRSPERTEAISRALTGRSKPDDHIAKLPQNQKGYVPTAEAIAAQQAGIRAARAMGRYPPPSPRHLKRITELAALANRGNKHTLDRVMPEHEKRQRSEALKGRPKTPETRENMRQAALHRWARERGEIT